MSRAILTWKPGKEGTTLRCERDEKTYTVRVDLFLGPETGRFTAREELKTGQWVCWTLTYPGGIKSKMVTIGSR